MRGGGVARHRQHRHRIDDKAARLAAIEASKQAQDAAKAEESAKAAAAEQPVSESESYADDAPDAEAPMNQSDSVPDA